MHQYIYKFFSSIYKYFYPDLIKVNVISNDEDHCECGRHAEDGSHTCSRFPMCGNRIFYP